VLHQRAPNAPSPMIAVHNQTTHYNESARLDVFGYRCVQPSDEMTIDFSNQAILVRSL
jgi:hypothetical protein